MRRNGIFLTLLVLTCFLVVAFASLGESDTTTARPGPAEDRSVDRAKVILGDSEDRLPNREEADIEPIDDEEVVDTLCKDTSDPNCVCLHAGAGWVKTGDNCKVSNDGAICTGTCKWKKRLNGTTVYIKTETECGTL